MLLDQSDHTSRFREQISSIFNASHGPHFANFPCFFILFAGTRVDPSAASDPTAPLFSLRPWDLAEDAADQRLADAEAERALCATMTRRGVGGGGSGGGNGGGGDGGFDAVLVRICVSFYVWNVRSACLGCFFCACFLNDTITCSSINLPAC
jgi:hypothetical protein